MNLIAIHMPLPPRARDGRLALAALIACAAKETFAHPETKASAIREKRLM